ncbi:MAG: winged helix-turn-helix domain-containing protein [Nitrospirota bacterium]
MSKPFILTIEEDLQTLKALQRKTPNHRLKTRLQCLILLKDKTCKNRQELATGLGVGIASVDRWLRRYRESGLAAMLTLSVGGYKKSIICDDIHNGLAEKLHNGLDPLKGYWDAVRWVEATYGVKIKYNTLRTYMIRHFKTKLKTPRKSHYKKDANAIAAFKKTSRVTGSDQNQS